MRNAILCGLASTGALTIPLPVQAQPAEVESTHTLEFGQGVYNIQLIDIGELKVAETGDPRSEGELRSVKITLWSGYPDNQFDSRTYVPPSIWRRGYANRNLTYLPIRTGDWVSMGRNRVPVQGPDNLWVHATLKELYEIPGRWLYPRVSIEARELDCTRDRVCRRGNRSMTEVRFQIPDPGPLPYTCQDSNTWDILPIDGTLQLAMPGARTMTNDGINFERYGLRALESEGPNLHLNNAKLCITRSTREPWSTAQELEEQVERARRLPRPRRSVSEELRERDR